MSIASAKPSWLRANAIRRSRIAAPSLTVSDASSIGTKLGSRYFYDYDYKCSLYIYFIWSRLVSLYLVAPGIDLSIELFVSDHVEKALALQWERLKDRSARDAFCRRMTQQLDSVIPDSIDWDIKEPTSAQVSFAMALSKELDVPIPPEALRSRGHMHAFLEIHASQSKARREQRKTS
jgi:hypothetical protein